MTGPNKEPGRNALKRLGADIAVVPDETKPRLVYYASLEGGHCVMHVVLPAYPWWRGFWGGWRPQRARVVMGHGSYWWLVSQIGNDGTHKPEYGGRVGPRTSIILAGLWVNREKIVERGER